MVDATLEVARQVAGQGTRSNLQFELSATTVDEPAISVGVEIVSVPPLMDGARVVWDGLSVSWTCESPLLDRHLSKAELTIISATEEKRKIKQAASMPTLLVIDIARAGVGWLRPLKTWAERVERQLSATNSFAGVAVGIATLDSNDLPLGLALRPNLDVEVADQLRTLSRRLKIISADGSK